jgi:hypothetical protein
MVSFVLMSGASYSLSIEYINVLLKKQAKGVSLAS